MLKELTLAVSIGVDVQAWLCMLALGQEQSSGLPAYLPFPSTLLPSVLLPTPHLWDIYVNEPTPAHCAHVSLYCLYLFRLMPWRFFFPFPLPPNPFLLPFPRLGLDMSVYPSLAAFFHVPLTVYHPVTLCLWSVVERLLFVLMLVYAVCRWVERGQPRGGRGLCVWCCRLTVYRMALWLDLH